MASPNQNVNMNTEVETIAPQQPFQNIEKQLQSVSSNLGAVSGHVDVQGTKLGQISAVLTTQAVATVVPNFDGKPGDFRNWVKAIEKYVTLFGLGEQDTKAIADQRSKGVVSDFVGRHIQSRGEETWEDLKTQLKARFGEIADPHHAFALLQKCKQRKDETVALYAERLYGLAEESFPNEIATEPVQRQLVGFFVDGLANAPLQMKVLRGTPDTFEGAVTIANREATFQEQFSFRIGWKVPTLIRRATWDRPAPAAAQHEPMKVDHARSRACFVCGKSGHVANNCKMKKVFAIPAAREVICYICRESEHFKRNCPKRQKNSNSHSQTRGAWSNRSHGLRRRKKTEADFWN